MKKLLGILALGLFLITPSQADDIRDFQIEGMSIGDSALNYFTEEEIEEGEKIFYEHNKFITVLFYKHPSLKVYDSVSFIYKPNDKKYKIYGVEGTLYFRNNVIDCYKKQDEIVSELFKLFGNEAKINTYTGKHRDDKSGNSKYTVSDFDFKTGSSVRVMCYDWSEKMTEKNRWYDSLLVAINSAEFMNFLTDLANE